MPHDTIAPTLFDLLARTWQFDTGIDRACFDSAGSALAFVLDDGRIAVGPTADSEPAEGRIRIEVDSGRSIIRPRENPVVPLTLTESFGAGRRPLVALDTRGFAVADDRGGLHRITPRGQVLRLLAGPEPITLLASAPGADRLATGAGRNLTLHDSRSLGVIRQITLDALATGLAFTPSGDGLVVAAGGKLLTFGGDGNLLGSADCPALVGDPVFSADAQWLAATTDEGALWFCRVETGRQTVIGNFPQPPRDLGFSAASDVLYASGAFRLTAWSLERPPFDGDNSGALRTGKPGLVTVTAAAANPQRDLAVAGTANGLVVLNRFGQSDEFALRPEGGGAVTALNWSPDGEHVAVGLANGAAALVALPKQLFK